MVFLIDDSLIKNIDNETTFLDFFMLLMISYKEGKHIIAISPKNVKIILEKNILSDVPLKLLKHYSLHNKAILGEINLFDRICKISASNIKEEVFIDANSNKEVVSLTIKNFIDTVNFQKTILLGENGHDVKIYGLICEYYRSKKRLNSLIVNYKIQSGGGSTIEKEYATIHQTNEEFCFCLLDSDKKHPSHLIGNTASKVIDYHNSNKTKMLKCNYSVLEALELENILPKLFYLKFYENFIDEKKGIFSKIEKLVKIDSKALLYLDFKKGLKSIDKYRENDNEFLNYWKDLIYRSNLSCDIKIKVDNESDSNVYFNGYGEKILADFLTLDKDFIFDLVRNSEVEELWIKIGSKLSSYILGKQKLRAI
jgi:hypothetical protein